jgi:hypothetical protein
MAEFKLFEIATKVATPLALGGLVAAAFFLIGRQIVGRIPVVKPGSAADLLRHIIDRFFVLALIGLVLGCVAYVVKILPHPNPIGPGEPSAKRIRVQGKVRQNTDGRAPVPFARVAVDDKGVSVTAEANGDFKFEALVSQGESLLFQVSADNFKPFREYKPANQFVSVLLDPIPLR